MVIDLDEGQGEIRATVLQRLSIRDLTHSHSHFMLPLTSLIHPGLKDKRFLFHAYLLILVSREH